MEVCGLMGPLGDVRLALHVSRGTMFLHATGPKTAWKHTDPGDILTLLKGLIVSLGYSRVRDLTNITISTSDSIDLEAPHNVSTRGR